MRLKAVAGALALLAAAGCGTVGTGVGGPNEATDLVIAAKTAYYRGDYATARTHFARARNLYERYDDREGVAYAWNNLGSVALRTHDYAQAERDFREAGEIFDSIGNTRGAAITKNNQGTALRYLERFADARQAHEAALTLASAAEDPVVQAAAHGGIGLVLLAAPQPTATALDEADLRFRRALELQRKAHDELGEAATLGNLGALAALRENVPEAITHYQIALELDRKLENVGGIAQDLIALAELHVRVEKYATALRFAERALRVHEEIQDEVGTRQAFQLIREIEALQGGQGLAEADPTAPPT